jgi:hypothetical protein
MAALNFPSSPVDGQLFPDPLPPGQQQYIYSSSKNTWQTVSQAVGQVFGAAPIVIKGTKAAPIVTINEASPTQPGYISTSDYNKIQAIPDVPGTVTEIVAGAGLSASPTEDGPPTAGGSITKSGTLSVSPATRTTIGGIRPGIGVNINSLGVLDLAPATPTALGGVTPGSGLTITSGGRLDVLPNGKNYTVLDDISSGFNGVQTFFPLSENSVPVFPTGATQIWIFLGGIFQIPTKAFNFVVGSSTIEFTGAPPSGTSFYGVVFL